MAYRGETIEITIKGDDKYNLDELLFWVNIYPDRHTDEYLGVSKSAMTKLGSNHYKLSIDPQTSADLHVGFYTIEIMVEDNQRTRSIYAKQSAFPVYDSSFKNIA